jgi:hypothetical protein
MRAPTLLSTFLIMACEGEPPATTVSLDTIGPPDLVAFKLGAGDWQVLEPDGNLYELDVTEPYVVAVACNDIDGLFDTYLLARTLEDDPELVAPCTGEPALDGAVQGTVAQGALVSIGSASQSVLAGAPFELAAASGPRDLVVLSGTNVAIRRDVEVAGTTVIAPAIDVEAEGEELLAAGFAMTNADLDEQPIAFSQLVTERQTSLILDAGDPAALRLIPDAMLGAGDRQVVQLYVTRDSLMRGLHFPDLRSAQPRTVALPEHLSGVTLSETGGAISATWGELPEHDTIQVTITTNGPTVRYHTLELTRDYAEQMGASVTLDLDIPGFDPAGAIDVTEEYVRLLAVSKQRDGHLAFSQVSEEVNQPRTKRTRSSAALRKPALAAGVANGWRSK